MRQKIFLTSIGGNLSRSVHSCEKVKVIATMSCIVLYHIPQWEDYLCAEPKEVLLIK
jgi:hypothetical protein